MPLDIQYYTDQVTATFMSNYPNFRYSVTSFKGTREFANREKILWYKNLGGFSENDMHTFYTLFE